MPGGGWEDKARVGLGRGCGETVFMPFSPERPVGEEAWESQFCLLLTGLCDFMRDSWPL